MSAQDEDEVDWKLCVLCQTEAKEKLTAAACSQGVGYDLLAKNLLEFHILHALPFDLKTSLIANINDLKPVLTKHGACWHKSCYLKINNTKLDRARIKVKKSESESHISTLKTRSSVHTAYDKNTCLFCGLPSTQRNLLCSVMKKSCSDYIITSATELNDYELLAKISETCDLISLEAKYHLKCYVQYKNRLKAIRNPIQSQVKLIRQVQAITFSEVVAYINEMREKEDEIPIFNVVELAKKQSQSMKDLGVDHVVQSSKLKIKLMEECPGIIAITKAGSPNLVTFETKPKYPERDFESEGAALSDVVKNIRNDIFDKEDDQSKAPSSLIALIKMIINGPFFTNESSECNIPCQNIADLIVYHTLQYRKRGLLRRHKKFQEKSGPVYLAAKLYATTRKKKLIECAHQLGVSISYYRLQSMITEEAKKVCSIYQQDQVVAPLKLQKGLFTTSAVDNVDHNPTSTSAETAFHGTAITLMQHKMPDETGFPRSAVPHESNDPIYVETSNVTQLPLDYAVVPPCFLDLKKFTCSKSDMYSHNVSEISLPMIEEQEWLQQTMSDTFKPWAAYHAEVDRDPKERHSTVVALLPIFKEQSHNAAMMLHSMKMVEKAVQFLNPGQTPVLVADQPLYALLKQLQYLLPESVGEEKILIMMGGLHVEMAGLKAIGQWLRGSGWVEALVQASVTSSGRAEAMLNASHVTRTRYAHQVTAAALYILQKKAYCLTVATQPESNVSFEEWRLDKLNNIPQFKYWDIVLQMELLILQLVRSTRTGNFDAYMNSLRRLVPWFFALDHNNYARWLSVHIRDLANLKEIHLDIWKRFKNGQFVARRSDKPFSAMAFDQAHEQMNALIKGDGGMIGLTEKPDTLRKWLIAGPEIAAMVEDFESEILKIDYSENPDCVNRHHSDTVANQNKFMEMVKSLEHTISDMSNPFLEETQDLYNIDSKKIASSDLVDTVFNIEKRGEQQYVNFCKERLQGSKPLQEAIKKNKYTLFSTSADKSHCKIKAKMAGLKNDCSLFSKLYIATCEHRTGDLDAFFAHENQPYPPALATLGSLRSCTKSDLIKCLTNSCPESIAPAAPQVSAKVLDGSAIVHMLNPGQSRTFGDYADNVFKPFVQRELTNTQRVDIIWDRYDEKSIKNSTREKRGIGSRTRVCPNTRIPKGWANFLRDNENKKELFHMLSLACHAMAVSDGKELNVTDDVNVLSSSNRCKANIDPCNHEEADTRIMLHVADALTQGLKRVIIRTVDTDLIVLAVSCVPKLSNNIELWVHIGTGKNHQFLSCDKIAASLGTEKARALPVFHALTGCDTVSAFSGRGKKTAYDAWNAFPAATSAFNMLADGDVENANGVIQKFIITMYDKSSHCSSLNECRKELFSKKDRQLENIPPTEASFRQHLLRSVYQGVHVWGQTMVPIQNLPSPADWGWETDSNNNWTPKWTTSPVAATACLELIRCKCKSRCGVRCNCRKKGLKCTKLCHCDGKCN